MHSLWPNNFCARCLSPKRQREQRCMHDDGQHNMDFYKKIKVHENEFLLKKFSNITEIQFTNKILYNAPTNICKVGF